MPEWVMKAKAQVVDPQLALDTAEQRALSELAHADLPDRHLPAEQLATAALQHLEVGRAMDAAVWLSLASYRYKQEWSRILRSPDVGGGEPGSLPAQFYQLENRELEVYARMNFDFELRLLGQFVRGEEIVRADLRTRVAELLSGEPDDDEASREAVRRKLRASGGPPAAPIRSESLSKAYLQHLRTVAEQKKDRIRAVIALAHAPLAPFALEAARWGFDEPSPGFCNNIANQLSTQTKEVAGFLTDPKTVTRANAAVVLGMNPDPAQVPDLERLRASEKDPGVNLTLAYALARHGQRARVRELTQALDSCPAGVCEEATALLLWLPIDLMTDVDPEIFVRLGGDVRQQLDVRLSAIRSMGEIGRAKSLSPRMREVLLSVAQEKNADLAYSASKALANDAGFSRELVLAALARPSPAYRPLLARLARVATVADLALLRQHMTRLAGKPGPEIDALIEAAGRLPGAEAEAQLLSWFDAHSELRRHIAFRLMARPQLEPSTDVKLAAAKDGDVHLLVRVIKRPQESLELLKKALGTGELWERLFAAHLAGLVRERGVKQELWSLVNYRNDRYYPDDATVRHVAMSSLLWIALDELLESGTPSAETGKPNATVAAMNDG